MSAKNDATPWPYGMVLTALIPSHYLRTLPLFWYFNELEEVRVACKQLARYGWDNSHQRISFDSYGGEYSFAVEDKRQCSPGSPMDREYRKKYGDRWLNRSGGDGVFAFVLWKADGCTHVFEEEFFGNALKPIPEDTCNRINDALLMAWSGKLACSDCGTVLPVADLPGHYFAARYCVPCWEGTAGKNAGKGGWKAVEARETYE